MRNKEEERLQVSCVSWFDYQYPQFKKLLFAVPNGGSRNKIEAANLKKQGVRAGVSDMILLYPGNHCEFICFEFKSAKGKQSESQIEFDKMINKNTNGAYIIVRSFEEFKNYIEYYLQN